LLSHPCDKNKDVARMGHPEFHLRKRFENRSRKTV